ncbi:GH36 C-terminal domain-containing protein [Terrisporobacter muris]|uniref:GH36 C-terminal domain-containing protein n=1 Tax=Terrisporobacter muris TaxID=2963284 RepID=A0A9X2S2M6_9FIRM|nr:GH36 C-terminal domain-containing protein [Terrisporobacter muris]MCR1824054.1 GH36 C-terminal domain-containing protein [Terrisporobacter muris]
MVYDYKNIREIVQEDDFFRLENTSSNDCHLFEYTKEDQALLFVFLPQIKIGHRSVRVKLRNFDEKAIYEYKLNDEVISKELI